MAELTHKSVSVPNKGGKGKRSKRKKSNMYTDYLYTDLTMWDGVASLWDLFGRLYDYDLRLTGKEADARSIHVDYESIARDLWEAVRLFEGERSLEELPKQYRLFDPDESRRVS